MSNQSYSPFHRFSVHAPAHPVGGQWQRAEDPVGSSSSSPDTSLNNVSDVISNQQPGTNAHSSSPSSTGTHHLPQATMTSKSPTEQLMHLAELQMMANRLGIPSMLPKPPSSSSTTSTMSPPSSSSPPAAAVTQLAQSSPPAPPPAPTLDYQSLREAYLLMLSQQPSTASTSSTFISSSPANADVDNGGIAVENGMASSQVAIQNTAANDVASPYSPYLTSPENAILGDEFLASPIFSDASPVFSDFLGDDFTSPLMSNQTSPVSPVFDEFNTSPGMDSPLGDFLNTPVMDAVDQVGVEDADAQWAPLFDDAALGVYEPLEQQKAVEAPVASTSGTVSPPTTISPSDMSPTVSPPNMTMSPSASTTPARMETRSSSHGQSRTQPKPQLQRRYVPNGTRKGVTPDTLIPIDAPIQSRYRTASSSSSSKRRKTESGAVPTGTEPDVEAQDDDDEGNEERKRAAKRERNTLAARTSRKRKLEHQLQLQDANDKLAVEVQQWKTRAEVMEGMLKANGWPGSMWDIKV
ncbi:hypothetical protein PM082_016630 [Marasmius tenuissimus]|nr:hypothetical protein PM082_016630 [Marasmius tenuissimus]